MGDAADDELIDLMFSQNHTPRRPSILEDFGTPHKEPVNMSIRETAQAQLERNEAERQRLLTRLAILDQFDEVDPWDDGAVLSFEESFGGPRKYVHVAIRLGGVWYVTGSRNAGRSFSWHGLVEEHLAKSLPDSLYVVSEWTRYEDA